MCELRTLGEVLRHITDNNKRLCIPSYQRGYRWKATEVTQLLDDVYESNAEHYFLQLLAVREDAEHLRIIDGQQRLTTVLLVLDCLDGGNRCSELMTYETRQANNTLDGHFKQQAREAIEAWLRDKSQEEKQALAQMMNQCEFIFFPIERQEDELEFFTRLNTWKIPATDAELVKCLFLSNDEPEVIERRALRWSQMERRLSDNAFWGMIANHANIAKDRMGVLLGYVPFEHQNNAAAGAVEKYPLFEAYRNASLSRDELWNKVDTVFSLLEKWYSDRQVRHLIGWYFHRKGQAVSKVTARLIAEALFAPGELIDEDQWLDDQDLYYTGGDDRIHDYLLLANVAWCSERYGVDYDFYRHSLVGKWSIEHVHARNQQKLGELEFKALKFKEGDSEALWEQYRRLDKEEANRFLQDHLAEDVGYPEEDVDNSLGNLALLPSDANSSLNNKLFLGKRREILAWALERDASAYWAPPLTVAMFVKEVGEPRDKFLGYWSKDDRKAYAELVKSLVSSFVVSVRTNVLEE